VSIFNSEMNQTAKKISLNRSSWANPHGLSNVNNLSTAEDVAKLCLYCMKNNQFREITSTKEYNCQYYMEQTDDRGER
jgi:D-alanyl-D-alanine carboxypeptidase